MAKKKAVVENVAEPTTTTVEDVLETPVNMEYPTSEPALSFAKDTSDNEIVSEPIITKKVEIPSAEDIQMEKEYDAFLANVLQWTSREIERCNDYIFASHNTNQKFIAYRQELYDYRYNVRRMAFHPYFPDLNRIQYPKAPFMIPDE